MSISFLFFILFSARPTAMLSAVAKSLFFRYIIKDWSLFFTHFLFQKLGSAFNGFDQIMSDFICMLLSFISFSLSALYASSSFLQLSNFTIMKVLASPSSITVIKRNNNDKINQIKMLLTAVYSKNNKQQQQLQQYTIHGNNNGGKQREPTHILTPFCSKHDLGRKGSWL